MEAKIEFGAISGISRRSLIRAGAAIGLSWASGAVSAETPAAAHKAGGPPSWRLLINEAVTGDSNIFLLTARYKPLADFVGAQFKGRPVSIEPVVDIERFVTLAQASAKPELVFGKSVNQLAKLVRDSGYQPIVRRADPYKAAFIVAKDSPIKTLADAAKANAKIIMPDEFSASTAVARAELRRQNVAHVVITHTRYQEAVAQQISNGFGQIGVVNPTIARKWVEQGGRVLAETQPVVNWSLLASPALREHDVDHLRDALMGMDPKTAAAMSGLGVKQWARAERKEYLALLDYTKE
jgi:ABC-type phosphate/phosphonate transport system substrate-binding protein